MLDQNIVKMGGSEHGCPYCGTTHVKKKCSLIKSIEFDGGIVKLITFYAPNDAMPIFPQNATFTLPGDTLPKDGVRNALDTMRKNADPHNVRFT